MKDGAILGSRRSLLSVHIGEGAIIERRVECMTKDVPAGSVPARNPARVLRTRIPW